MSELSEAQQWAKNLSTALHQWLSHNGYQPKNRLRDELGLEGSDWLHLSRGDTVLGRSEAYARIFLRTELAEADPRHIPPMLRPIRGGGFSTKSRAWTDDQWEEWRQGQAALAIMDRATAPTSDLPPTKRVRPASSRKRKQGTRDRGSSTQRSEDTETRASTHAPTPDDKPTKPAAQPIGLEVLSTGGLVGLVIDSLIADLASKFAAGVKDQLTDQMVAELRKELAGSHSQPAPQAPVLDDTAEIVPQKTAGNIGELASQLVQKFLELRDAPVAKRDAVAHMYGHKLGELLPYLRAFTLSSSEARERALEQIMEISLS